MDTDHSRAARIYKTHGLYDRELQRLLQRGKPHDNEKLRTQELLMQLGTTDAHFYVITQLWAGGMRSTQADVGRLRALLAVASSVSGPSTRVLHPGQGSIVFEKGVSLVSLDKPDHVWGLPLNETTTKIGSQLASALDGSLP